MFIYYITDDLDIILNDIALIRVSEPFDFTAPNVDQIAIADLGSVLFEGDNCTVSGWGYLEFNGTQTSPSLQKVEVPIVDHGGKTILITWHFINTLFCRLCL